MTKRKTFKKRVRARMDKTGERYAAARRQLLPIEDGGDATKPSAIAGVHPVTTAFRLLTEHAGHDLSEASLLIAGGGVGIGVFTFHYPEMSTLFLAGRHLWHDDLAFLQGLADRLGATVEVRETGGAKRARTDLVEMVEQGPVIAFVDLGTLGHRGGVEAYYVVVVLDVDVEAGTARIADLSERPIDVSLDKLMAARAKHRGFKNRLLRLDGVPDAIDVTAATRAGVRACIAGFDDPPMRGSNFRLDGLDTLAKRMRGAGKDSWAETFPPGPRLWSALGSFYEYVQHYGSGGGLLRTFYSESLRDAGASFGLDVSKAADAYAALGAAWSGAARACLPSDVPELAELAATIDRIYDVHRAQDPGAPEALASLRAQRSEIARGAFPVPDAEALELVHGLADRVDALAASEREAVEALRSTVP